MSYTRNVEGASFTRPANTTAYAAADLVANDTDAADVVPLEIHVAGHANQRGCIKAARIRKSGTGVTNATFSVHLFKNEPEVTNGDNGAFAPTTMDDWMGEIAVTVDVAGTAGAAGRGAASGNGIVFEPAGGTRTIYALVEATGAYTPASGEVFTVELEVERD